MLRSRNSMSAVTAALIAVFALSVPAHAFAQTKDHAPVGLSSAEELSQDQPNSESWTYLNPNLDLSSYKALIVDPAVVYTGPDAQFNGIDPADRAKFADIMTVELRQVLAEVLPPAAAAGRDALRLQVTILGAQKTTGGAATATRVMPIGLAVNALKSVAGKPGSLTGSLLIGIELTDATTGELLLAAVRRRHPDPLDVPATLSTTDTVKAVARDFAKTARERLQQLIAQSPR